MYLAFGMDEDGIGIVENGQITSFVDPEASIGDIVSGEAREVQSDRVGTRAKSTELVKVVGRNGEYTVSKQIGGRTVRVSASKKANEISFTAANV